ncbi:MAG: hypothetical protein ABW162_16005 [Candidatus Sedimenticola sp. PURPLELP]
MYYKDNYYRENLPVYEVKELTMEEALLVFAAEKEAIQGSGEESGQSRPHSEYHSRTESVAA